MKWLLQALSRHSIVRYSQESCLQGGVEPQYWIQFRMLNYWLLVSSNLNVGHVVTLLCYVRLATIVGTIVRGALCNALVTVAEN